MKYFVDRSRPKNYFKFHYTMYKKIYKSHYNFHNHLLWSFFHLLISCCLDNLLMLNGCYLETKHKNSLNKTSSYMLSFHILPGWKNKIYLYEKIWEKRILFVYTSVWSPLAITRAFLLTFLFNIWNYVGVGGAFQCFLNISSLFMVNQRR